MLFLEYVGTDFFSFRLQIGSLSSSAATVAITVGDEEEGAVNRNASLNGKGSNKNKPMRKAPPSNHPATTTSSPQPNSNQTSTNNSTPSENKESIELPSKRTKPIREHKGDIL